MSSKTEVEVKEKVKEGKGMQTAPISQISAFEEMDRLFDRFLENRWARSFSWPFPELSSISSHAEVRVPSVDVVEKDNDVIVRAEIPGIKKKDIDITLNANNITIQGKSRHEKKEETAEYHRCEISAGSFSRTLTLPCKVDDTKAKATFSDGILEVTLTKAEKAGGSHIDIE